MRLETSIDLSFEQNTIANRVRHLTLLRLNVIRWTPGRALTRWRTRCTRTGGSAGRGCLSVVQRVPRRSDEFGISIGTEFPIHSSSEFFSFDVIILQADRFEIVITDPNARRRIEEKWNFRCVIPIARVTRQETSFQMIVVEDAVLPRSHRQRCRSGLRETVHSGARHALPTSSVTVETHYQFRARNTGFDVTLNRCVTIVSRFNERRRDIRGCFGVVLVQRSIVTGLRFPSA